MKLVKVIQETDDVKTLRFEHEGNFSFKPGQFVMVSFDIENGNEKKTVKRSYSLSSSPTEQGYIEITLRILQEGAFSKKAESLKEGETLEVLGPFGRHFVYEEGMGNDLVLVAGGTGIAPIRSIMKYIIDKKLPVQMLLFYSSKEQNDIIFKDEFMKWEKEHNNLKVIHTLTQKKSNALLEAEEGRINENFFIKYIPDLNAKKYYLCGSTEFVNDLHKLLVSLRVPKNNIVVERFG